MGGDHSSSASRTASKSCKRDLDADPLALLPAAAVVMARE